jgi:methylmalonyl-CoA mutase C-terminal domain/subunit
MSAEPVRVLLCKPGLDGHDRGVKVLARACRDAGMEVIYGGVRQRIEEIAAVAIQEDVDVIGVSNHSGLLPELCEELMEALREHGAGDIPVVAGGTLVGDEQELLDRSGVKAVYGPGSPLEETLDGIERVGRARQLEKERQLERG